MEMLRDKIKGLERKLIEMIRHGQDNVAIADKLHRWTRALMLTANAADLPDVLVQRAAAPVPDSAGGDPRLGRRRRVRVRCRSPRGVGDDVKSFAAQPARAVLRRQRRLRGGRRGSTSRRRRSSLALDPAAPREPEPARSACSCSPRPTRRATPPTWAPSSWPASARSRAPRCRGCCPSVSEPGDPSRPRRRATPTSPAISITCRSSGASPRARSRCTARRSTACERFAAAPALPLREAEIAPRPPLGGAAARRRPGAALIALVAVGVARLLPLARARGPASPPTRSTACARRAPPSRCRRRSRSITRSPWSRTATSGARRRSPRATRASSSCSTAAACGSASWSGSTSSPAARAAGWIDAADASAHVLGKGGKRRSVPVGAPALRPSSAWLAQRGELAPRRRGGALRQPARHAASPRARCARA